MKSVSFELPDSVFSALHKQPSEFVQEMRIAAAVKWYELGEISQRKAAEIAGLSCSEFMDALSRYKTASLSYVPDRLGSDIDTSSLSYVPDRLGSDIDSDSTAVASKSQLSLRQIAALPVEERHRLLVPFIAATAEDFLDPEFAEFPMLEVENCDRGND
ncbi:UPF0175 family protein [Calothrix sp. 336/3]|uniref:UPF0175 family protein n=1 Tax=Calothrix sp. 336/3 TaxID=1337936 RepID=UPI0009E4C200|nr:UPF0175 family protein [Calothrix sp. 336/3]